MFYIQGSTLLLKCWHHTSCIVLVLLSTKKETKWSSSWNPGMFFPKMFQGWGGVGWVMKGWGGVGVSHEGVGWGVSWRGGVGHEEIGWVMKGWGGLCKIFMNCMKQPQGCISTKRSWLYLPHFIKVWHSSPPWCSWTLILWLHFFWHRLMSLNVLQ